jgi:F-type H+-transporting ATPase subunit delta
MAEKSTIARPYAEAVFELASEQSQLQQWSDMLQFASAVVTNKDMHALIDNANITKEQLVEVLLAVSADHLTDEGNNLIKVLVENDRLNLLPEITAQFETLKAEAEKTIEAEVVSAFEVTEAQQKLLAEKLKARLGREVSLQCRVDESLLGGVVIKAGDLVIDGSTKGQIQKLSIQLAG